MSEITAPVLQTGHQTKKSFESFGFMTSNFFVLTWRRALGMGALLGLDMLAVCLLVLKFGNIVAVAACEVDEMRGSLMSMSVMVCRDGLSGFFSDLSELFWNIEDEE